MHDALAGRSLTRTDFRVPQHATADLTGRTVVEVVARGKHMLTRIEGGITLHTHFKMARHLADLRARRRVVRRQDARGPRRARQRPTWRRSATGCRVVELLPTGREADVVGHLGPDLLGPDWDEAEALRRLRRRSRSREIGEALLDQRNLAGIGNLYKTEVLFLSGISPWTRSVTSTTSTALVRRARRLLLANRDRGSRRTTGNLRRGEEHWVFERTNRPCRRCGTADPPRPMQGDAARGPDLLLVPGLPGRAVAGAVGRVPGSRAAATRPA